ncbi:MAG TPA: hypothetical protein VIO64_00325 [Pseudobacteroides sp.]|uniref:hypothetical protein n=1 Tax=Pseudobacteroides sp. TaxID=1968840 RepID=UPI002F950944
MNFKIIILSILFIVALGCSSKTPQTPKMPQTPQTLQTLQTPQTSPTPLIPTLYRPLDFVDKAKLKTDEAYGDKTYFDLMFAPIGWSKDGKFAYITGIYGGGAGNDETGYFRWVIQDMVTDKYLWQSERGLEEGLPMELRDSNKDTEIFKWVYSNLRVKYKEYLDKYGIIIHTDLKVSSFPLEYNNNKYTASIADISYGDMYGTPNIITKYKVLVNRNGINKTFSEYKNQNDMFLNVQIGGYIKSPYEPRVALVLSSVTRGWEGAPHPVKSSFVGCHLEIGY